jgi:uncharacterized protein (TIGR00375 family)
LRVIADFHIHSRFSRATSKRINVNEIARFARVKGLDLMGTGDFTHPTWLKELNNNLTPIADTGVYRPTKNPGSQVRFMITSEVSTVFNFQDAVKKIHHVILTPNFETAAQINNRLALYGDLTIDGRPSLKMSAPQLVEEVMSASPDNVVFPAHVWTPWFSLFGAFSGFDRIEDCYQDMTKHIFALETGLSSDPPMNWRLSALDRFSLVSNSDSHSCWPWRIGREANVFELEQLTYLEVVDAIRRKDPKSFRFTVETDPAYGKYHWTGHRNCKVSMPPEEAEKFGNYCPVCRKPLTKGVDQRVQELADRPVGFKPEGAIGYKPLLPLSEIIKRVLGASSPSTKEVWNVYNMLIEKIGDEFTVLMDASKEELCKIVDPKVAETIILVREEKIQITPGYDGVYGQLIIPDEKDVNRIQIQKVGQQNITEFM